MRVLIVEDDPKLAKVLKRGLKEQGYAVDLATTGPEALEFALAAEYDAVLLDVMIPGKDGFTVLKELRREGYRRPVIMLTSRALTEDRVQGLDLGADDYLPKPFQFPELLARLRALLRRPPLQTTGVLKLADLELDPSRHSVQRSGKKIELTSKEFSLLEYLLRKKDVVVTRAMIQDHVWDYDYSGGTNLVDVYINYLRTKIDADYSLKLIQTVRGTGYVMKEEQ